MDIKAKTSLKDELQQSILTFFIITHLFYRGTVTIAGWESIELNSFISIP
jgi:hypothetical protein